MSLWLVRAGKYGEEEQIALDENVITIGWNEFSDFSTVNTREDLTEIYWEEYPDVSKKKAGNEIGQIWRFIHEIKIGDLVALPLKTQSAIAIGEVKSNYEYKELSDDVVHIRHVKWLKILPRSAFDQDILYSLGAFMTVCKIERNDAEKRVVKLIEAKEIIEAEIEEENTNIEDYSKDQIVKYIGKKFKGHDLTRLVNAILRAQGFITKISPPGPDGGIDILASAGSLGFDEPRICVQVKSSSSPIDVRIVRELQGVMSKVKAGQGLLVSWGGFHWSSVKANH